MEIAPGGVDDQVDDQVDAGDEQLGQDARLGLHVLLLVGVGADLVWVEVLEQAQVEWQVELHAHNLDDALGEKESCPGSDKRQGR